MPNPSFECFTDETCFPTLPSTYYQFTNRACNWFLANHGTSDIFSTMAASGCWTSMPKSATINPRLPPIGFQMPHTGNRFAGIFTFSNFFSWSTPSYREYLEVKLDSVLVEGEHYCAEMYVSLAEGPRYAANNLGFYFHDQKIDSDTWSGNPWFWYGIALEHSPQVVETEVILDTTNWVRVSGIFQATSPAQYLTIGNFSRDINTAYVDKTGLFPEAAAYENAYYFIDDVKVQRKRNRGFTFSGRTDICQGDSTTLHALGGFSDITWSLLTDTMNVLAHGEFLKTSPEQTNRYRVKGVNCETVVVDTVEINVLPRPQLELGDEVTGCKGHDVTLDAGDGHTTYLWSDFSTNRTLTVTGNGDYGVQVKNAVNCYTDDTVRVVFNDIPRINLGRDTLLCEGLFFPLYAGTSKNDYVWSIGSVDSVFTPSVPGRYWVKASNVCGYASDSIRIFSFDSIFIPNVITINDDNLNATFRVVGLVEDPPLPHLTIVNRWGDLVYEDRHYQNTWPLFPENLSAGMFYYTLQYVGCKSYKGIIHVLKN